MQTASSSRSTTFRVEMLYMGQKGVIYAEGSCKTIVPRCLDLYRHLQRNPQLGGDANSYRPLSGPIASLVA